MEIYKEKHCIFISANRVFIPHLKICILSIKKNYKNHPDIIICHTDFLDSDFIELKRIIKWLIFIKNNLSAEEIGPIMWHLPETIDPRVFYARFLIWKDPYFRKYKSVLHLDADVIVLKDLSQLLDYDSFYIEKEFYDWDDKLFIDCHNKKLLNIIKSDSINLESYVWNAGVFMIPHKYINIDVYNELLGILNKYKDYIKWADQSILNIWIQRIWIKISTDNIYNFQHRYLMRNNNTQEVLKNYIIHFNGIPDPYRIFFMWLLFRLNKGSLGIKLYKYTYIITIKLYNLYAKIANKPLYHIY